MCIDDYEPRSAQGALDRNGRYTLPRDAVKGGDYICVACNRAVMLRAGQVRRRHFAHMVVAGHPCAFFDRPGESDVHMSAKLALAQTLRDGTLMSVNGSFSMTHGVGHPWTERRYWDNSCGFYRNAIIVRVDPGDQVLTEHRGATPDGKSHYVADVAVLRGGAVQYVFEVCHTHPTVTRRPEPWFEVDARNLLRLLVHRPVHVDGGCGWMENGTLIIDDATRVPPCPHSRLYENCGDFESFAREVGWSGNWVQPLPCGKCGRKEYIPLEWGESFQGVCQSFQAVCHLCIPSVPRRYMFIDE